MTDLSQAKNGAGLAHEVRNLLGTVHNSVAVLKHLRDANGQRRPRRARAAKRAHPRAP